MRTLIILPDGTEVFSGTAGAAVVSAAITRGCNEETDLTPGAVIPAKLELRLTGADIAPCDRLTVYRVDAEGRRSPEGIFSVSHVGRRGMATSDVVAYDLLFLLEQDVTSWLSGLEGWPYTLQELAEMTCTACGLTFATEAIPNGSIPVDKFAVRDVTGADMLGWIAQLSGCFCRADVQGRAEFAWYAAPELSGVGPTGVLRPVAWQDGDLTLRGADPLHHATATDDGAGNVTVALPRKMWYYRDSLTRQSRPVAAVERVLLRRDVTDVGVSWPENGGNTCILSSPMLTAIRAEDLLTVAQTLYRRLAPLVYTPCEMVLPGEAGVATGQILTVTDGQGESFTVCVTGTVTENGRTRLRSTGNHLRDNTRPLRTVAGLRGKMLSLQVDVDGIRAENTDAAGRIAQMAMDVEGIRTQVTHRQEAQDGLQSRLSAVEQRADSVDITLRRLTDDGTDRVVTKSGYSFTEEGLTIRRQGEQMCNLLDHTGMYVTRDGETILQVNHRGVEATDVTVRNYLVVGDHARLEDYETGTACYYI